VFSVLLLYISQHKHAHAAYTEHMQLHCSMLSLCTPGMGVKSYNNLCIERLRTKGSAACSAGIHQSMGGFMKEGTVNL